MNIKPPRLKKGDEIGIIAPAGPVTPSEIQPEIENLASRGYHILTGPHLYDKNGYLAGSDEDRLDDLHSMFESDRIKAVFCARGGYGTLRLLDKIDYDLIQGNPKIIIGYSDITALLLAVYKLTGLVTFHGPVVRELSRNGHKNLNSSLDLLSSPKTLKFDISEGTVIVPGKARGTLIGGNLSLISCLTGTPFMPSMKGAILFIEDRMEPLYRIDRMLTHLRLSGSLNDLAGLVAGKFIDCGEVSEINRLLLDVFSGLNIPVCSGFPVGHGNENEILPIGLQASLDTEKTSLSILDSYVN